MQYGHFDDSKREYVITNPRTPWPWINYLGNEDFFSLISNTAGGYSFYKDAKFRRITRYLVGTLDRFNDAKRAEERDRVKHGVTGEGKFGPIQKMH